jgi:DNA-binding MarR family transcriptional regulator
MSVLLVAGRGGTVGSSVLPIALRVANIPRGKAGQFAITCVWLNIGCDEIWQTSRVTDRRPLIARLAPLMPQIAMAMRRNRGEVPAELKPAGRAGGRHIAALITLAIAGPMSVSELAQRLNMTVAHASLIVGELADAELVERDKDPGDRRRVIVTLSETAKPALNVMRQRNAAPLIRFLDELGDERASQFIDELELLLAKLLEE